MSRLYGHARRGRSSTARLVQVCASRYVMADAALTDRIIAQGHALVRAIEALGTIEPSGPFERALV
jgi:hypothetical protein